MRIFFFKLNFEKKKQKKNTQKVETQSKDKSVAIVSSLLAAWLKRHSRGGQFEKSKGEKKTPIEVLFINWRVRLGKRESIA